MTKGKKSAAPKPKKPAPQEEATATPSEPLPSWAERAKAAVAHVAYEDMEKRYDSNEPYFDQSGNPSVALSSEELTISALVREFGEVDVALIAILVRWTDMLPTKNDETYSPGSLGNDPEQVIFDMLDHLSRLAFLAGYEQGASDIMGTTAEEMTKFELDRTISGDDGEIDLDRAINLDDREGDVARFFSSRSTSPRFLLGLCLDEMIRAFLGSLGQPPGQMPDKTK